MRSNWKTECLAGITSFLATMYIIPVNPSILAETGMPVSALTTSTIVISFFASTMMGLYAKNPIVVAPGMGLNAFFTYSVVLEMGVPWKVALAMVFWSGVIFLLLGIFNIRVKIAQSIPTHLRYALAVGIGLFISFIGMQKGGLVTASPVTLVTFSTLSGPALYFIFGVFGTAAFLYFKIPGALCLGIICTSLLAFCLGDASFSHILALPDFSLFGAISIDDLVLALQWSFLPAILSFLLTDLFDSLSTFVGVAQVGNLLDKENNPRNLKKSFSVDAISTLLSGLIGTSPATAYIESAAGIQAGGRSGLSAVVAGVCFLPFLFLSPLVQSIPSFATAPALFLVGLFMIKPISLIDWNKIEVALPCFLSILVIPFSFSITAGIVWGYLAYLFLTILGKNRRSLGFFQWVLGGVCLFVLFIRHSQ